MYFVQHTEDLINMYQIKLKDKLLKDDNAKDILEGICKVVFSSKDPNEIQKTTVNILSPWISQLLEAQNKLPEIIQSQKEVDINAINDNTTELNEKTIAEMIYIIKIVIKVGYKTLPSEHQKLLTTIFTEIWNIIKFYLDSKVNIIVEEVIQLTKYFMRGMCSDFKPYLKEFLFIIVNNYQLVPLSSYLYCFEISVTVFVNDKGEENLLKEVIINLAKKTFNSYLRSSYDYHENPQLTEDFFGLLFRTIKLNPLLILDSDYFEVIFYNAISNLDLEHPDSARNLIYFIQKTLNFHDHKKVKSLQIDEYGFYYEKINSSIKKYGQDMITKIIQYILSAPLKMLYQHLVSLINEALLQYNKEIVSWFSTALLEVPEDCLTNTEKVKIMSILERNSKLRDIYVDPEEFTSHLSKIEQEFESYMEILYQRSISKSMRE